MNLDRSGDDQVLACGTPVGSLLALVADRAARRPDADSSTLARHVSGCAGCQRRLRELASGWEPVRREAAREVAVPPNLVEEALHGLATVRQRETSVEVVEAGGSIRVSRGALVLLVRQEVADFAAGTSTVGRPTVRVSADGVTVEVAARYGVRVPLAADALRRHLVASLDEHFGTAAPAVRVLVTDVLEP
ncbi:hypothetical protein [Actinoalloteichus caeruleus]|uniref:Asp23/Gls24 family envelope stress response protein n=1 Tax=Actinoalloteichus caeruleus DSM 43889 TaxID=1120930 RepID=A0ABT1JGT9_ACTCY|nr:hypothetical protein [Actinoalloteichus caeruleus]MCP2331712.1 hypothetical protein [Actinoalloteichus caeruleus DSM 43889]